MEIQLQQLLGPLPSCWKSLLHGIVCNVLSELLEAIFRSHILEEFPFQYNPKDLHRLGQKHTNIGQEVHYRLFVIFCSHSEFLWELEVSKAAFRLFPNIFLVRKVCVYNVVYSPFFQIQILLKIRKFQE